MNNQKKVFQNIDQSNRSILIYWPMRKEYFLLTLKVVWVRPGRPQYEEAVAGELTSISPTSSVLHTTGDPSHLNNQPIRAQYLKMLTNERRVLPDNDYSCSGTHLTTVLESETGERIVLVNSDYSVTQTTHTQHSPTCQPIRDQF